MATSEQSQTRDFCRAAAIGDCTLLQKLIAKGMPVDVFDNAPLRRAISHGQNEAVRVLVSAGASLEHHARELLTAAILNGATSTLELLLCTSGFIRDKEMLSDLLAEAVRLGRADAVSALLCAGANASSDIHEYLREAALRGDVRTMQILLDHGADACIHNSQLLFDAVCSRSATAVDLVLAAGVDCSAQLGVPLLLALSNGDGEIAHFLLDAGVPLTAPEWIVHSTAADSLECLQLLLSYGVDLHQHADAIVAKAAQDGAVRILRYVINHAPVESSVVSGGLESAVRRKCSPAVEILLNAKADPAFQQSAALRAAIDCSELTIARSLLMAGARTEDLHQDTLAKVMEVGDILFAKDLLRKGLQVDASTMSSFLAARVVVEFNASDLVENEESQLHPRSLFRDRISFAKEVARMAIQDPGFQPATCALWLGALLARSKSY